MRADRETDALYAGMRRRFGARRAEANGYRYAGYFHREQALLLSLLDADAAVVLDVACGSGLMLEPLRDGAIFPQINRANYAVTIYPPVAQMAFFVFTRVGDALWAVKLGWLALEALAMLGATA